MAGEDSAERDDALAGGPALEDLVGYNLKRVHMIFRDQSEAVLGLGELSARHFSVLALVAGQMGITQATVARQLGIKRPGLVSIVDELQQRGYIDRLPVRGDRRAQALSLTEQGIAAYHATAAAIEAHEDVLLSALTAEERTHLNNVLAKLRQAHEGEI